MTDVAKLAGVSAMTVSRVLNDRQNVLEETRKRVFAAIEQLQYQPNELAKSLREQRSRQIGILIPYLFDPFFAICAHEISTIAKQHSYSVVISTSNEDPQSEYDEASRMLRRNVEGLIVIPAQRKGTRSLLVGHAFERLPIVTLDRPIENSRFDSLLVENERGSQIGTEHLLRLGHRRIAYVGLAGELYTMHMRRQGFTAAMNGAGRRSEVVLLSGVLADAAEALRPVLSQRKPPTALFCANNLVTRQVLHTLQQMKLRLGEDIALVGFDDFETADLLHPGITVVRQPTEELARTATKVLFKHLANGSLSEGGRRTILPVELVIRGSCGAGLATKVPTS